MRRHPIDLVSLLLGSVAIAAAVAVFGDWVTPEWFTARTAQALAVLAPTVVLAVLLAQYGLHRLRRERDERQSERSS